MRKACYFFFAFIYVFVGGACFSADLLGLYEEAKVQDATFSAAKADFIASQEVLPQSKAHLQPEATFQADSSWNRIDFQAKAGGDFVNDYGDHRAGVTVTQPLYRPQSSIAVSQARTLTRIAEVKLRNAEQDLILAVANRYFLILQKKNVLKMCVLH